MADATTENDIAACERAMCELLDAIIAYDRNEAAQARRRALTEGVPTGDTSFERMALRALVCDPVRSSLKAGVKAIGREIYRLGGRQALDAAIEFAASADSMHYGLRGSIVDSAWNGVGEGNDRWWS